MALIRFEGRIKSKRFDEYGNCYIGVSIEDCHKISHINNSDNIGAHIPRCDEFKILNERPLSCANHIDVATCSEVGESVAIKAYELFNMNGDPLNRYQTADFKSWR